MKEESGFCAQRTLIDLNRLWTRATVGISACSLRLLNCRPYQRKMRLCNCHSTLNFGYSSSGCFKPQLYCRFNIILVRFFSFFFFFKYSATKDVSVFCVLESPYITCFQNCLNTCFYHDYNYSERPATVCCEQPRKKSVFSPKEVKKSGCVHSQCSAMTVFIQL